MGDFWAPLKPRIYAGSPDAYPSSAYPAAPRLGGRMEFSRNHLRTVALLPDC